MCPAPGIGGPTKDRLGCPRTAKPNWRASSMHRKAERKRASAKRFNKGARKTHAKNISIMRGGYRL